MLELSSGSVSIPPRMSFLPAITSWLQRIRTSARMAFVWRMVAMGVGSLFSLLWMKLLLLAMGNPLMGLFQTFQSLTRLGGLGDLGITGALSLQAGTMLGRREETGLRTLLASARTLFLLLAGGLCILFVVSSLWLPHWLGFEKVAGVGSMKLLFVYGGLSLALMILGGYFASLNYAHGTVTWPIFPGVLFVQVLAPFFHWRLALLHLPLWVQLLPYLGSAILVAFLAWRMLKWSHPWLGDLTPLKGDRAQWKTLAGASGWMYLVSLGTAVYLTTDRVVIGAGIDFEKIPSYNANYKACELLVMLIVSAAFVSFPKITQWIASPHEADRRRLLTEVNRLSVFEIVLGCGAVLGYLAFNNIFVELWIGKAYQVPLPLQFAFACNLAVTVGGNAGINLSMRAGDKGLKYGGLAVAGTGLLNLILSIVAVELVSVYGLTFALTGVAAATVIAQSVSSLFLGTVTCRYLRLSALHWAARCWLLPIGFTLVAAVLKELFPLDSIKHLAVLSACYGALFLLVCWLAGMNRELLRSEINQARSLFLRS
jgi:O-antigen/teichoic acid export membrane protein